MRQINCISVAMCTYNGASYIAEQIESILMQSHLPDEIVICDDGSVDETVSIIENYKSGTDLIFKIIKNEQRLGFVKNFEKAISSCQGDIIFLADQDDIWHFNKIDTVIQSLICRPDVFGVTHNGRLVNSLGEYQGFTKFDQIKRGYGSKAKSITGTLSCLTKDSLGLILPFPDGIKSHDKWINYVFSWLPQNWIYLNNCLSDIRRHDNNTSIWVVNSFKPINRIDVLLEQLKSNPSLDYADRLSMNSALSSRLSCNNYLPFDDIRYKLLSESKSLTFRSILIKKFFLLRLIMSIYLFISGGYKYFNGYKSFLRDIVQR